MFDDLPCRLLNANPLVAVADGFLDPAICARLIETARDDMRRAQVGTDHDVREIAEARTNSDAELDPRIVPDARDVMDRMARAVGLPASHGEGLSVLHYAPGEQFTTHVDGIWSGASAQAQEAFDADGGQRLFTAIAYLNAVAAGGGTVFPMLELRIPPEPGRLLVFANTDAGMRDASERSAHAGEAVSEGEKWVAVSWWRERPYSLGLK